MVTVVENVRVETDMDIGLILVDSAFVRDDEYRSLVMRDRGWIQCAENVPPSQMPRLMSSCDVFVRAVEHESLGVSRVEALWCGLPVIATSVGETRGMLTYEFGDIQQLSEHLKTVLNGGFEIDTDACYRLITRR